MKNKMKMMKKLFAIALVAAMVMALCVTALAAQTEGKTASITITADSTKEGTAANTYKAYKIFDAKYAAGYAGANTQTAKDSFNYPDGNVAYFMKTGNPWISTVQGMSNYFTVKAAADGSGYTVELKSGVDNTAETAKIIATTLKNALFSLTLTGDYEGMNVTAGGSALSVQPGYYLIASDTATNLQLVTTDVTLVEKNEYIHDNKVAETASVSVGQNATYYIEVFLPANIDKTKPVVVHDDLAAELKFNNDVKVYTSTTAPTNDTMTEAQKIAAYKELTYGDLTSAYNVKTTGLTDTCDFEINITTTDLAGKYLVFKYSAELLATAKADTGYVNKEFTTYSDYTTTPSQPEVKTYDFNIKKVDDKKAQLANAHFELRTTAGDAATAIDFFAVTGGYMKADAQTSTTIDATTTKDLVAGNINIAGLGAGTYYLVETEAPATYNKLDKPVVITIADNGTISASYDGSALANVSDLFEIENKAGSVLPSTGGIGTKIFYGVGAVLVIGAGVVLMGRKRAAD